MDNENIINESVEMEEVAELPTDVEESEEIQEVAEPEAEEVETVEEPKDNGRTEADRAFAEQRRRIQELEKLNKEQEASNKQMFDALSRYFNGETAEELSINANAYAEQRDPEEYRKEYEHNKEFEALQAENESLKKQMFDAEVDRRMEEGLREIQEIDPEVKSLDELGESFPIFIRAGLSTKDAYYAVKAKEMKEKVFPPDALGKVADTKTERDYYTSEELDKLTDAEMDANWDKVKRSMDRL